MENTDFIELSWIRACKSEPRFGQLVATVLATILLTGVANGNVTGSGFQNFTPSTDAGSFVTVHSAKTVPEGTFNLGMYLNQAVNTLPYFEQDGFKSENKRDSYRDGILSTDLFMTYGVLKHLNIGVHIPQILKQNVDANGPRGQFSQNGITEATLSAKYQLWQDGIHGIAIAGSMNVNTTSDNPYLGQDRGYVYNAELIAETTLQSIKLAANLGYRFSGKQDSDENSPIKPFGNQLIASLAAGYRLTSLNTDIVGEIYGSGSPKDGYFENSSRQASAAESIVGLRYHADDSLRFDAGVGTELFHGNSTPDYRIYAGVQWLTGSPKKIPTRIEIAPLRRLPDEKITIVSDVLFKLNSDRVEARDARAGLKSLIESLQQGKKLDRLVIEGHTCSIGSRSYNKTLSTRRAKSIKQILVRDFGVPAYKIVTVGQGERYPIASNDHEVGRERNRRVEFKIYRISH